MSDALQVRATATLDARERARYGRALGARARFNAVRQRPPAWSYTPEEEAILGIVRSYLAPLPINNYVRD